MCHDGHREPMRTIWLEPHRWIGIIDPDLEAQPISRQHRPPTPKPPRAFLVFVDRRNDGQTSARRLECETA
jgi:hypothetical protein